MKQQQFSQQGIGLIEVMVSLIILAIAVLGYAALQTQAIKATDESIDRSQSLVIMRNIGEKIRANPNAIATYAEEFEKTTNVEPNNKCGIDGGSLAALCNPTDLAKAEAYYIKEELDNYNFEIQIHPCPSTGGSATDAANNIMYSYCLLAAWGNTTPTITPKKEDDDEGTGAVNDCLTEDGVYHSNATCMMMEL